MQINNAYPSLTFTTAQDALHPDEDLNITKTILDNLGLKWFLAFGTALGFYRDKDFIKGDTDIDIAVLADDDTLFSGLIITFRESGYELIRQIEDEGRIHQLCFQGLDYFIIDICFFYKQGEVYETLCEGGKYHDKIANIGNLQILETKFGDYPIPERIEEYLTDRYGDWQTPRYGEITQSLKA